MPSASWEQSPSVGGPAFLQVVREEHWDAEATQSIKENQVFSNNAIPSLVFLGTQKATWYLFLFF